MSEEVPHTKEELQVDWKKLLDAKKENAEAMVRNLEIAVNGCLPDAIEVASRLAEKIGDLRETAVTANIMDDISEEEWHKIQNYTYMREENLATLTDRFKEKCKCQIVKPEM